MKPFISSSQLILLVCYVMFIVHTVTSLPEEVENAFIAHRRQQREARHSARFSPKFETGTAIGLDAQDAPAPTSSSNWAGAELTTPPSGKFNSVSAQWIVPTPSLPPDAYNPPFGCQNTLEFGCTWMVAVWVGIDGDNKTCNGGLWQAGTVSYVQVSSTGSLTTGAYAWYEWYPELPSNFSSFPVIPGDTVQFSVTALNSSRGTVDVNNLSTGNSTTISLDAKSDSADLCGKSVEWVVEDPMGIVFEPFAQFTTVNFQRCQATTTTDAKVDLTNTTLIAMIQSSLFSNDNDTLATAVLINQTELEVHYGSSSASRSSLIPYQVPLSLMVGFLFLL